MDLVAEHLEFREAVCRKFGCAPEAYAEAVFSHCLYPHAAGSAKLIRWLKPDCFAADFELIHQIATVTVMRQVRAEVENHRYHYPSATLLRRFLRIRLSGRRVIQLADEAFAPLPTAATSPPPLPQG